MIDQLFFKTEDNEGLQTILPNGESGYCYVLYSSVGECIELNSSEICAKKICNFLNTLSKDESWKLYQIKFNEEVSI